MYQYYNVYNNISYSFGAMISSKFISAYRTTGIIFISRTLYRYVYVYSLVLDS